MVHQRFMGVIIGLVLSATLVGCGGGTGMRSFDVEVSLSPGMGDPVQGTVPSLEVDLVGVNESEALQWSNYPLSEYFSGSDDLRAGADKYTVTFTSASPEPKTLERSNAIWDEWEAQGATWLYVLVNLPTVSEDSAGGSDPRRRILPLAKKSWDTNAIEIEILRSGLKVNTAFVSP